MTYTAMISRGVIGKASSCCALLINHAGCRKSRRGVKRHTSASMSMSVASTIATVILRGTGWRASIGTSCASNCSGSIGRSGSNRVCSGMSPSSSGVRMGSKLCRRRALVDSRSMLRRSPADNWWALSTCSID